MQPRISSCLLSLTAGMTLALFGLTGIPGMIGEAHAADRSVVQHGYTQTPKAFAPILIRRAPQDRGCKRSIDNGCTKEQFPKPLPRPQ